MSRDLEKQLAEMGPAYREVVDRLRAAYEPCEEVLSRPRTGRVAAWTFGYLVAAALLAVVALSVVFSPSGAAVSPRSSYTLAYVADDPAIDELVRTQNPDGSWANDFLTCQNAAALRGRSSALAAYRRAVRYLRSRGLRPLSDGELKVRGDIAAQAVSRG